MVKVDKKRILRIIDANINRLKEGFRVVEDIFRFLIEDRNIVKEIKRLRHIITEIVGKEFILDVINCRDTVGDVGKYNNYIDIEKKDIASLIFSNLQRCKESLRVLEEMFRIIDREKVDRIRKVRFATYGLEKKITRKWPSLHNYRQRGH